MADLAALQAQRQQIISQIHAKGGQAKAPNLTKQLQEIEAQIRAAKAANPATPAPATPGPIEPGTGTIGDLGQAGIDAAINKLRQSRIINTEFAPEVAPRQNTGDITADRQRIEEALFANLTKNTETDRAREIQAKEQELYNRGIPVGSQLYNDQMKQLNDRYDSIIANARNSASVLGGQELLNSTNAQEMIIGNQYNQAAGVRNQNLSEIEGLAGLEGSALEYALKKKQLAIQQQALNKSGGGGGGAPAPAPEPNPFNNSLPPGL